MRRMICAHGEEVRSMRPVHGTCVHEPAAPAADTHLLDIAAHWMEIRVGREDVLHEK
jgi:hypothetical protein